MKINGREVMYRSFEGYNVTMKAINLDTDEISVVTLYIEGKFAGDEQAKTWALDHYNSENMKAFKVLTIEKVSRKMAMYLDDYIKNAFEIDDNFKPIEK